MEVSVAGPAESVDIVVTTVHGTFASDASWVQPQSKLGRALNDQVGAGVVVIPCRWSGGNSPAAREEGRQLLCTHLHRLLKHYPNAHHFVIAHSHGGNVALYAMRDAALENAISGVACLATPFIVARRRVLGSKNTVLQAVGAAITPTVFGYILAQQYMPPFAITWLRELLLALILIVGFALVGVLLPRWKEHAERLLLDLRLAPLSSRDKLLLIRAPADEAGAGLAFVQFISQLNVRVYLMLSRQHEVVRNALDRWAKHRGRVMAALLAGLLGYFTLIAILITVDAPALLILAAVLGAAGIFVVVPVLILVGRINEAAAPLELASYLVLFGVICALSVLLLPFGRQIARASVFLDVTAETTPPGEWTVHLLVEEPAPVGCGELQPLQHSMVYDNDQAIRTICDWVARRSVTPKEDASIVVGETATVS